MAKKLIKEIRSYVKLYRDTNNGIAWIEDGSTGLGISVHPNLDKSGSVTGMKKLGYWDKSDRIVLSHGWKYNIDRFVCDAVKEALRLGCEVYDENGEIIFSQWDGWNGDYPDIKKKAFPVADMEMVKKAQNFLKKTSTYEDWCSFKNNQFHKWIGKAEWLHSDRWSAAYDWVYDGKFADVDIPDDIINCLVEEWEKSMGLKVGI